MTVSGAAAQGHAFWGSGALVQVAAPDILCGPAGGRCDGLDSCLLPLPGRTQIAERLFGFPVDLLLSRPSVEGASA